MRGATREVLMARDLTAEATPRPDIGAGYYVVGGVLYYHGPDFTDKTDWRPRDRGQCEAHGWPWSEAQRAAYEAHLREVTDRYTRGQSARPSAEEQYQMRAAFGPGRTVVDWISGRRHRT
jgi:hypothetical protein